MYKVPCHPGTQLKATHRPECPAPWHLPSLWRWSLLVTKHPGRQRGGQSQAARSAFVHTMVGWVTDTADLCKGSQQGQSFMPLGRIQNPSLPLFPEHLNPFHLENLTSVRIIRALHILCFHITCQEGCSGARGVTSD